MIVAPSSTRTRRVSLSANRRIRPVLRNKEDWPEAAEHSRSRTRNQRWIDFLRSTPVANTETMLLVYGLFQKGRVLAQDGLEQHPNNEPGSCGRGPGKRDRLQANAVRPVVSFNGALKCPLPHAVVI